MFMPVVADHRRAVEGPCGRVLCDERALHGRFRSEVLTVARRLMQHAASLGILGCMRTTVDLPDELLTQARSRAADEGTTLTALLADGLRLRLARRVPPASARRPLPTSRNRGGMQPWIDPGSNASLLDAADDDSAAA